LKFKIIAEILAEFLQIQGEILAMINFETQGCLFSLF